MRRWRRFFPPLAVCQQARPPGEEDVGRLAAKKEQANTLRLAPSTPKHKREGHANFSGARGVRASSARVRARMGSRVHPWQSRDSGIGTSVASHVVWISLMDHERFRPSPGARASISGDGLILLDVDEGLVLTSNVVGARIWQLIEQDRTTTEIVRQIVDDYDVPIDRARRDVAMFVAALMSRGLVAGDPRA